jgi:hypothetical protein
MGLTDPFYILVLIIAERISMSTLGSFVRTVGEYLTPDTTVIVENPLGGQQIVRFRPGRLTNAEFIDMVDAAFGDPASTPFPRSYRGTVYIYGRPLNHSSETFKYEVSMQGRCHFIPGRALELKPLTVTNGIVRRLIPWNTRTTMGEFTRDVNAAFGRVGQIGWEPELYKLRIAEYTPIILMHPELGAYMFTHTVPNGRYVQMRHDGFTEIIPFDDTTTIRNFIDAVEAEFGEHGGKLYINGKYIEPTDNLLTSLPNLDGNEQLYLTGTHDMKPITIKDRDTGNAVDISFNNYATCREVIDHIHEWAGQRSGRVMVGNTTLPYDDRLFIAFKPYSSPIVYVPGNRTPGGRSKRQSLHIRVKPGKLSGGSRRGRSRSLTPRRKVGSTKK